MNRLIIAESYNDSDMFYATRVLVPDAFIYIVTDSQQFVLVNQLEYARVKKQIRKGIEVVAQESLYSEVKSKFDRISLEGLATVFFGKKRVTSMHVPPNFPTKYADFLRKNGFDVQVLDPFFPERAIKSAEEIKKIEGVQRTIEKACHRCIDLIKKSKVGKGNYLFLYGKKLTSEFLRREMNIIFMDNDCEGADTIVSSGVHTAYPHHHGTGPIKAGVPIVMDIFPRSSSNRYFSDMTRTVCKGKPSNPKLQEMYDLVLEAQAAGYKVIREGATGAQVHAAVVDCFKKHGMEKYFIHGTGHGLGVDIHESPRISPAGGALKANMVITNEPGLYIEGIGGIRIEDTLVVTKTGYKILTKMPKKFVI